MPLLNNDIQTIHGVLKTEFLIYLDQQMIRQISI
jgi:Lrp/AsnC family transcriptional regulator for asnA, asnC and gidA